jgi:hypothetical protein
MDKSMKKLIYAPAIFNTNGSLSDRINNLFLEFEKTLGFKTIYSDLMTEEAREASLILVYAGYHGHRLLRGSLRIPKRTKIIYLLTGPHSFNLNLINQVIERGDLNLITYEDFFLKRFPHLKNKVEFFPLYFAPYERYAKLKWKRNPIMMCLLTGHTNPRLYPLRYWLRSELSKSRILQKYIVFARHPRWGGMTAKTSSFEVGPFLNEDYAKILNEYYCSIATDSIYRYGLAKYYEIPAAGCLLLATQSPDIDKVGFKPWKHYIRINKSNVIRVIKRILSYPENFDFIRQGGRDFVMENHSARNRVAELEELMERIQ